MITADAGSRRLAWFNCALAGIAGDMALGALVDAGADATELCRMLERLPLGGWRLEFEACQRASLAATRAVVSTSGDGIIRTFSHIAGLIEEARFPERVADRALSAFSALAEAEGRLHRRPPSQVHFHEVGGHDAVVDIVGSAVALELLGVDEVAASPVAQGVGVVRSAHGLLPNPAPATVALLTGIPTLGRELSVELTTPTGAAMLRAWSSHFGALPDSELVACGYGAGTRELEGVPNCTQVVIGLRRAGGSGSFDDVLSRGGEELVVLEANLDDVTGETLSGALDEAMRAGALDAWITPVVMKKGRPAHVMSVLCEPVVAGQLAGVLMATTGTLGVRLSKTRRVSSTRSLDEVDLDGYRVRMKVSPGRVKAEHDDVARVAARSGTPVIELAARAEAAWRARARPATAGSSPSALDKDPGDDVSPSPPGA